MKNEHDHRSVAQAFYQLNFYLQAIGVSFTIKDLYRAAYLESRKDRYQDEWLNHLEEDPHVLESMEEPFTTHSIAETLIRTGHEPVLRVLMKRVHEENIGFTQAYIVGARKRPQS
ncbi:hypothetical protein [Ferroacidibacillus organovorans]|uniref:Uncharacterized protein n=1 Tax=Ferroacidibacillus organovorans TaxID=1765683 RepID=A0A162UWL8_9BACL|nr:hypothetical protein [Ferroacidibacillus organovorans]KYP82091.1 hypothetical protein AYJ22_00050 [Ferroacidibacillus organovorans]OAG91279.1 hypothetical protein AYW79_13805 [Ferroacidibacillus organovorans]OPG15624.1 hypothetical protein B2M26_11230 [Ferroacidibacillus organovorans]